MSSAVSHAPRSGIGPFPAHLNESDAILWHIERDPALRTTIVAVAVLDRTPDVDRLRARLLDATVRVPRLRQRVVETPLRLGPPRWVDDDRFDLDYHLRRVSAPAPGDLRAVLDVATPIVMSAFDKERPLWEFTLVEGMQGGGAALIQKLHHSLVDGVGGIALATMLLDDAEEERPAEPPECHHPPARTDPFGVAVQALVEQTRGVARTSWRIGRAVPGQYATALRHPAGAAVAAIRTVRSVGKLVAPVHEPLSPVMRGRSLGRRLEAFDVSLDRLRAAAHAGGTTLNDAFLAAVTAGMRRYHEQHGDVPPSLRVTMPINVRRADDAPGGNRFTPARFAVPITTVDPVARMRELGRLARDWRDDPTLDLNELIAGSLNRLPVGITTSLFGSMLKAIDFVATNVPGLQQRAYLAGAEVLREYAFAPPSGSACSVALLSHRDRCCIGVTVDVAAVPDPGVIVDCLRAGFDDVLAVADAHQPGR